MIQKRDTQRRKRKVIIDLEISEIHANVYVQYEDVLEGINYS